MDYEIHVLARIDLLKKILPAPGEKINEPLVPPRSCSLEILSILLNYNLISLEQSTIYAREIRLCGDDTAVKVQNLQMIKEIYETEIRDFQLLTAIGEKHIDRFLSILYRYCENLPENIPAPEYEDCCKVFAQLEEGLKNLNPRRKRIEDSLKKIAKLSAPFETDLSLPLWQSKLQNIFDVYSLISKNMTMLKEYWQEESFTNLNIKLPDSEEEDDESFLKTFKAENSNHKDLINKTQADFKSRYDLHEKKVIDLTKIAPTIPMLNAEVVSSPEELARGFLKMCGKQFSASTTQITTMITGLRLRKKLVTNRNLWLEQLNPTEDPEYDNSGEEDENTILFEILTTTGINLDYWVGKLNHFLEKMDCDYNLLTKNSKEWLNKSQQETRLSENTQMWGPIANSNGKRRKSNEQDNIQSKKKERVTPQDREHSDEDSTNSNPGP